MTRILGPSKFTWVWLSFRVIRRLPTVNPSDFNKRKLHLRGNWNYLHSPGERGRKRDEDLVDDPPMCGFYFLFIYSLYLKSSTSNWSVPRDGPIEYKVEIFIFFYYLSFSFSVVLWLLLFEFAANVESLAIEGNTDKFNPVSCLLPVHNSSLSLSFTQLQVFCFITQRPESFSFFLVLKLLIFL